MIAARAHTHRRRALAVLLALAVVLTVSACGTSQPKQITAAELAEAQTFPYYRVYWVGRSFDGHTLATADGLNGYISTVGDSVYYGNCVRSKGIFGGGSCLLPLQVTTVIYALHSNSALGTQSNTLIRGVPATIYDGGRSIELYTGRVAVDVFSNDYANALRASEQLLPINAPGSASGDLPAPVYCPGLSGPVGAKLESVMANLPNHACQQDAAEVAYTKQLQG